MKPDPAQNPATWPTVRQTGQVFRGASWGSAKVEPTVRETEVFHRAWRVLAEDARSGVCMAEVLERATDEIWLLDSNGVVFHANEIARKLCPAGADWLKFQPSAAAAWRGFAAADASRLETSIALQRVGWRQLSFLKCWFNEREHVLAIARRIKSAGVPMGPEPVPDNWLLGAILPGFIKELNGSLTSVLAAVAVLESQTAGLSCDQSVRLLLSAVRRSGAVLGQMNMLASRSPSGSVPLETRAFLSSLKGAVASSLPKSIQIRFDLPGELPEICADPRALLCALLTLCIWSTEPMEMEGMLRLKVERIWTRSADAAAPRAAIQLTLEASSNFHAVGQSATTSYSAARIPGEVLCELRTRLSDMGVGLEMDCGTPGEIVAKVVLPCREMAKQAVPKPGFSGRGESLLICDDDPSILESLATLLRKQGYVVDTTADGAEAIAAFTKSSTPYDLVICDARMPYMDGISTLRALQAIRRSVRFLLMSGSGVPGDALVASPSGVVGFLPKPFEADFFLNRVAELLSRSIDEPSPRSPVACEEAAEGLSFHVS